MNLTIVFQRLRNCENLQKKGELLISLIPDLRVYTIKTPLIGRISIKTVFSWSQKPSYQRSSCICVWDKNNYNREIGLLESNIIVYQKLTLLSIDGWQKTKKVLVHEAVWTTIKIVAHLFQVYHCSLDAPSLIYQTLQKLSNLNNFYCQQSKKGNQDFFVENHLRHGSATIVDKVTKAKIPMVTGGWNGGRLDSTELLINGIWQSGTIQCPKIATPVMKPGGIALFFSLISHIRTGIIGMIKQSWALISKQLHS